MAARVCQFCGKRYFGKTASKKYCSKACSINGRKAGIRKREQPCWTCTKACGQCSWSKDFTPIPNWDAIPTIIKDNDGTFSSYKIKYCPEYERDI